MSVWETSGKGVLPLEIFEMMGLEHRKVEGDVAKRLYVVAICNASYDDDDVRKLRKHFRYDFMRRIL